MAPIAPTARMLPTVMSSMPRWPCRKAKRSGSHAALDGELEEHHQGEAGNDGERGVDASVGREGECGHGLVGGCQWLVASAGIRCRRWWGCLRWV